MNLLKTVFLNSCLFICVLNIVTVKAQNNALSYTKINSIKLRGTSGKIEHINTNKVIALILISPECPLCKNYMPLLKELQKKYKEVAFYGIVPGTSYSTKEVADFTGVFDMNFPILIDNHKELTSYINGTTTPEAILINSLGIIQYRGLIDNWPVSLGQKRKVVTEKYLDKAIDDLLNKRNAYKETKPVGCLINDI